MTDSDYQNKKVDDSLHSSEILEEILELSRDNQKLLRNPDVKLYDDIERVKESIDRIASRNDILYEKRRMSRKYSSMFLDEIRHISGRSSYAFLMTLSILKDDFPWIYDMGKELTDILKSNTDPDDKLMAIRDFKSMVDFTFNHPLMRESFGRSKDGIIFMKELPFIIMGYLDDMYEQYR